MKIVVIVILLALLGFASAAGFVWSGVYNVAADEEHTRPVYAVLETLRDRSIAVRAKDIEVPNLQDTNLISSGAGNYEAMCVGCHLSPGLELSELSRGLYPAPPNLAEGRIKDPAAAFWAIKHGIKASGMPAWGKSMDDQSIWGLVAFLRQLPSLSHESYRTIVDASAGHSHGSGEETERASAHDHDDQGREAHEHQLSPAEHVHDDGAPHSHHKQGSK